MLSIRRLIEETGGQAIWAEAVLLQHYTAKLQARRQCDRRYAAMQFVMRWAPIFRRHVTSL